VAKTSMNTALLHFPAVHIHLWRDKQGTRSGWNQVLQRWLGSSPYQGEAIIRIRCSPDGVSERGLLQ
ncbi:Bifunctional glutamine synthetase adenylyltransferase/adenylyl-removing enzyme, partial [Dissostichus eleginoides]